MRGLHPPQCRGQCRLGGRAGSGCMVRSLESRFLSKTKVNLPRRLRAAGRAGARAAIIQSNFDVSCPTGPARRTTFITVASIERTDWPAAR